jgi:hypothetical protein
MDSSLQSSFPPEPNFNILIKSDVVGQTARQKQNHLAAQLRTGLAEAGPIWYAECEIG